MWTLLTWPKGHSGNHWANQKNSALVGNNSMRLECVIYSFLGTFPPAFPALDSVKSASSFSWVHNALGQPTSAFTPSSSLAPCCGQNSHRAQRWLKSSSHLPCPVWWAYHWHINTPVDIHMRDVAPAGAICCLAVHLHRDWNTRPKKTLCCKVWTAGLTVENAGHLSPINTSASNLRCSYAVGSV